MTSANERHADVLYDPTYRPDIYFEVVFGNCLAPIIDHGNCILVDQNAPIRPGDLVSIWARSPRERNGLTTGFVKRFIGWRSGTLITEMINPRRLRLFPAEDVIAVHRIISTFSMGRTANIDKLEQIAARISRRAA